MDIERNPSKSLLLSLLATLLGTAACGAPPGDWTEEEEGGTPSDVAIGTSESALWRPIGTQSWPRGRVPVCFGLRPDNPRHPGKPYTQAELNDALRMAARIRTVVEQAYESISGADIDFTGWGRCASDQVGTSPDMVHVNILPYYDTNFGIRFCHPGSGPIHQGCSKKGAGYSPGWESSIYVTRDYKGGLGSSSWDAGILHEFGHALGFAHEIDRHDWDGNCNGNSGGGFRVRFVVGRWPGYMGEDGHSYTAYDPSSIMNATYCHNNPVLSRGDKEALAYVY